jgi:4-amino-4-deoxy-L-arabinose transferase-like glycosyltransferase
MATSSTPSRCKVQRQRIVLLLVFLAVLGTTIILVCTPWGIGVGYDSVFYLSSAENLLAGRGLHWPLGGNELKPLTHYPPLYPFMLAGLGMLGVDLVLGARLMAAVLFGANVGLLGWLVWRHTSSKWAALAVSILALVSPSLLTVHLEAMTEPLFVLLLLLSIALLAEHLRGTRKWPLIASAVFAGLAGITRYIGPSIVAAAGLGLIVLGSGRLLKRIGAAALYTVLGLTPVVGWYFRNASLADSATNRELLYHPIMASKLKAGADTVSAWLLPISISLRVRVAVFGGILILFAGCLLWRIIVALRRRAEWGERPPQGFHLTILLILFCTMYVVILSLSLTFVDASTRLNTRILSPLYVASLLLFVLVLASPWFLSTVRRARLLLLSAIWVAVCALYLLDSLGLLATMRSEGGGFTGRTWQSSETVASVRDLDPSGILYSTESLPLYFLTGRPAYWVPEKINPLEAREEEDYDAYMDLMRERLKEPASALVIFNRSFNRTELPPVEEVVDGLSLMKRTSDGAIYVDPVNVVGNEGK